MVSKYPTVQALLYVSRTIKNYNNTQPALT